MNTSELIESIPILKAQLSRIQAKAVSLKAKLAEFDVPKYRTAGIIDQLILQLQQAIDGDDLYTALEADYSDTKLVWE
jgi:hypothetical protein